jgi:hypothetical protein
MQFVEEVKRAAIFEGAEEYEMIRCFYNNVGPDMQTAIKHYEERTEKSERKLIDCMACALDVWYGNSNEVAREIGRALKFLKKGDESFSAWLDRCRRACECNDFFLYTLKGKNKKSEINRNKKIAETFECGLGNSEQDVQFGAEMARETAEMWTLQHIKRNIDKMRRMENQIKHQLTRRRPGDEPAATARSMEPYERQTKARKVSSGVEASGHGVKTTDDDGPTSTLRYGNAFETLAVERADNDFEVETVTTTTRRRPTSAGNDCERARMSSDDKVRAMMEFERKSGFCLYCHGEDHTHTHCEGWSY